MSLTSYHAGLSAEHSVAGKYARCGFDILASRFKSPEGEIDLIARRGEKLYFIEVKQSKTFDRAAAALGARQMKRIQNASLCYLQEMGLPLETDMRFDVALVDGTGFVKVIPDAIH
jgi:putative endonuclease